MSTIRIPRAAAWACALLLSLAGPGRAGAEDEAGDPEAFARSMKRLEGYVERGTFDKGLREMGKLLEAHGEQAYVRARRWELLDLAERYAFGAGYEPPGVGQVLSGDVRAWNPDTGELEVAYDPKSAGDLLRLDNGTLRFPFDTLGPFSLQVYGDSLPGASGPIPWVEFLAEDLDGSGYAEFYHVSFGSPDRYPGAKTLYVPPSIERIVGKERKTLCETQRVRGEVGRPFVVQVKVEPSSISGGVNGGLIGTARRKKDLWGWIGFRVPTWTKALFRGYVEPSYIQERLDLIVQKQLLEFRKTFRKEDVLPAWLFAPPEKPPTAEHRDLPVELDARYWPAVRRFHQHMKARAYTDARAQLAVLAKEGVPDTVVAYLSAQHRFAVGEETSGLTEVERCLGAAPDFLGGLLLKGRMLGRLRRGDEALEVLRSAVTGHPSDPLAYEVSIHALLDAGRPDAGYGIAEMAAHRGVASDEIDRLSRALVKAIKGPPWSRVYEYKSRNYHVFSDIGKRTCVEASKLLEEALTAYKVHFHWVSRDTSRLFPVYVFRGRFGFDHYIVDLEGIYGLPQETTLGLYHPQLKQLLVRDLHDRDRMFETIRHEGFHQYLDRFLPDPPLWLNEGLAVYHQRAERKRGRLEFGGGFPVASRVLAEKGWVALKTFLFEEGHEFMERGFHSYAEAWVLAHMLMDGPSRWQKLREGLVEDLQVMGRREALEKHFPPAVVEAFETDARAHAAKLAKER